MNGSTGLMARVESRRARRGISQAELAARCGMSQGHYSKLVNGLAPGPKAELALRDWLGSGTTGRAKGLSAPERKRAARLLASISDSWAKLSALLGEDA